MNVPPAVIPFALVPCPHLAAAPLVAALCSEFIVVAPEYAFFPNLVDNADVDCDSRGVFGELAPSALNTYGMITARISVQTPPLQTVTLEAPKGELGDRTGISTAKASKFQPGAKTSHHFSGDVFMASRLAQWPQLKRPAQFFSYQRELFAAAAWSPPGLLSSVPPSCALLALTTSGRLLLLAPRGDGSDSASSVGTAAVLEQAGSAAVRGTAGSDEEGEGEGARATASIDDALSGVGDDDAADGVGGAAWGVLQELRLDPSRPRLTCLAWLHSQSPPPHAAQYATAGPPPNLIAIASRTTLSILACVPASGTTSTNRSNSSGSGIGGPVFTLIAEARVADISLPGAQPTTLQSLLDAPHGASASTYTSTSGSSSLHSGWSAAMRACAAPEILHVAALPNTPHSLSDAHLDSDVDAHADLHLDEHFDAHVGTHSLPVVGSSRMLTALSTGAILEWEFEPETPFTPPQLRATRWLPPPPSRARCTQAAAHTLHFPLCPAQHTLCVTLVTGFEVRVWLPHCTRHCFVGVLHGEVLARAHTAAACIQTLTPMHRSGGGGPTASGGNNDSGGLLLPFGSFDDAITGVAVFERLAHVEPVPVPEHASLDISSGSSGGGGGEGEMAQPPVIQTLAISLNSGSVRAIPLNSAIVSVLANLGSASPTAPVSSTGSHYLNQAAATHSPHSHHTAPAQLTPTQCSVSLYESAPSPFLKEYYPTVARDAVAGMTTTRAATTILLLRTSERPTGTRTTVTPTLLSSLGCASVLPPPSHAEVEGEGWCVTAAIQARVAHFTPPPPPPPAAALGARNGRGRPGAATGSRAGGGGISGSGATTRMQPGSDVDVVVGSGGIGAAFPPPPTHLLPFVVSHGLTRGSQSVRTHLTPALISAVWFTVHEFLARFELRAAAAAIAATTAATGSTTAAPTATHSATGTATGTDARQRAAWRPHLSDSTAFPHASVAHEVLHALLALGSAAVRLEQRWIRDVHGCILTATGVAKEGLRQCPPIYPRLPPVVVDMVLDTVCVAVPSASASAGCGGGGGEGEGSGRGMDGRADFGPELQWGGLEDTFRCRGDTVAGVVAAQCRSVSSYLSPFVSCVQLVHPGGTATLSHFSPSPPAFLSASNTNDDINGFNGSGGDSSASGDMPLPLFMEITNLLPFCIQQLLSHYTASLAALPYCSHWGEVLAGGRQRHNILSLVTQMFDAVLHLTGLGHASRVPLPGDGMEDAGGGGGSNSRTDASELAALFVTRAPINLAGLDLQLIDPRALTSPRWSWLACALGPQIAQSAFKEWLLQRYCALFEALGVEWLAVAAEVSANLGATVGTKSSSTRDSKVGADGGPAEWLADVSCELAEVAQVDVSVRATHTSTATAGSKRPRPAPPREASASGVSGSSSDRNETAAKRLKGGSGVSVPARDATGTGTSTGCGAGSGSSAAATLSVSGTVAAVLSPEDVAVVGRYHAWVNCVLVGAAVASSGHRDGGDSCVKDAAATHNSQAPGSFLSNLLTALSSQLVLLLQGSHPAETCPICEEPVHLTFSRVDTTLDLALDPRFWWLEAVALQPPVLKRVAAVRAHLRYPGFEGVQSCPNGHSLTRNPYTLGLNARMELTPTLSPTGVLTFCDP